MSILDDLRAKFPKYANLILFEPILDCRVCRGTGIVHEFGIPCLCTTIPTDSIRELNRVLDSITDNMKEIAKRETSALNN